MGVPRIARPLGRLIFVFALLSAGNAAADAQQDAEKNVRNMNKKAMADYDNLEFELARRTLQDAVSILRQNSLDDSPIAARTYLNLGLVYVSGFKDRNRGLQQFVQALKIDPSLKLDPAIASPDMEEVFNAARKQVGVAREPTNKNPDNGKPPPPNENPPSSDDIKGLQHQPVDEARPGEPLTVKAQVGSDVGASKLYVMYRAGGQADYTALPMKNVGGADWVAVIPGEVFVDKPLQYYIEARDKKGKTLMGSGSAPSPYIITLSEVAPGARIVRRDDKKDDPKKFHRLFVFLMPGFGFGYHPGGNVTEVAWQLKSNSAGMVQYQRAAVEAPGGVAIAPFHIAVEAGGMITRGLSLSLLGRFEVVTGANAQTSSTEDGSAPIGGTTKAGGAVAGFLRARYRFLNGKLHPYVHVDFGGGEIRHALNLSAAQTMDKPLVDEATARAFNDNPSGVNRQLVCAAGQNCYDTLKMGYLFVGGGAGLWYDVWKYVGLIFDVNVLGAIGVGPGGQSGLNIDIQLGVGAHFL